MKKIYGYLFLFFYTVFVYAANPFADKNNIGCPTQSDLSAYVPVRAGQNKLKFWFGGSHLMWAPMSIVVTMAGPYNVTDARATPQIQPRIIELSKDESSGDWTIKCTFEATDVSAEPRNPVSTRTIQAKECVLNKTNQTVSCK